MNYYYVHTKFKKLYFQCNFSKFVLSVRYWNMFFFFQIAAKIICLRHSYICKNVTFDCFIRYYSRILIWYTILYKIYFFKNLFFCQMKKVLLKLIYLYKKDPSLNSFSIHESKSISQKTIMNVVYIVTLYICSTNTYFCIIFTESFHNVL